MATILRIAAAVLVSTLACAGVVAQQQRRASSAERRGARPTSSNLTGVYRIDIARSDKLYSVVAGASSNLPFGEQQRFFIDLAVRLTPPDLIAIERRGRSSSVTIGSSRAPRVTFEANGVTRIERASDGHAIRSRAVVEGDKLIFTADGSTEDDFSVIFASVDNGRRLRVTRRISAEQLSEPVVIQTFYNKISDAADWSIYGEPDSVPAEIAASAPAPIEPSSDSAIGQAVAAREGREATALRANLDEWIAATNERDIRRQMDFYMPQVKAFYLARNVSRAFVRDEKVRAFSKADVVEVRAEAPEIIFQEGGRTAVMRFRKTYAVGSGARLRSGKVVQELRWRRTAAGWRIFSERDVRVIH
jgi:ketosteroid isomerase-like protein